MKKTSYFLSLSYDTFFSHPVITNKAPENEDYVELSIINVHSESIARTLSGKYLITNSNICFDDPHGLINNITIGEVHLILATYCDYYGYEERNQKTEVIHAEIVDDDHASEFKAFAYNYNGKPTIEIADHAEMCCDWDAGEKAYELNAPYIIGIESRSFVCHKAEAEVGCTRFNEEFFAYTHHNSRTYFGILPGDIVQINMATAYGDFYDGNYEKAYELLQDVENIGVNSSHESVD